MTGKHTPQEVVASKTPEQARADHATKREVLDILKKNTRQRKAIANSILRHENGLVASELQGRLIRV